MSYINNRLSLSMRNIKSYITFAIPFIIVFTGLRFYDFYNIYNHSSDLMTVKELMKSVGLDFMLSMAISGLGLILFLIISFFSLRIGKIVISLLFSILIIAYIAFAQYFNQALVPLDQVIFIYDFSDIIDIALGSGALNIMEILVFVFAITIFFSINIIISKTNISNYLSGLFALILMVSAATTNVYVVYQNQFYNELSYYCNANKFIYFVKAIERYSAVEEDSDMKQIGEFTARYRQLDKSGKKYGPRIYPFQYRNDKKSTLSKFFNALPEGEKPNIVFIIVESLSPTVSGKYTPNVSFTPFLDSLAERSLYWRNCISTAERTFGVMPALLASLPPYEKGFMYMEPFPKFKSLPKMLKHNGYTTQLLYGGWPGFTNMDKFVNAAGIDSIYWHFPDYEKMPEVADHTWGYGDNVLFKATDKYINSSSNYLNVYLTLSTHSPFVSSDYNYLKAKTDSIIENIKDENSREKAEKYADGLKSFMVLDNEIRLFLERYKERPEYEKTIFIITGDHKGLLYTLKNNLDKYIVPLIIYSPLLNSTHEFGGVVTHNDVFPSIQNLLSEKYGLDISKVSHSIGCQLDTTIAFHANNTTFPMRNSREMNEFINGKYYLSRGLLYEISDTMNIKLIENNEVKIEMEKQLDEYIKMQKHVLKTNSLLSPMEVFLEEK